MVRGQRLEERGEEGTAYQTRDMQVTTQQFDRSTASSAHATQRNGNATQRNAMNEAQH